VFFDELTTVLESLVLNRCPVLIGGDINIHVEDQTDIDAIRLADLLASFNLVQHVVGPTHRLGGTLDLVASFADCVVSDVNVDPHGVVSDHGLVTCSVPAMRETVPWTSRSVRSWRSVGRPSFRDAIRASAIGVVPPPSVGASELFDTYDSVLRNIADRFAPAHSVRCRRRLLAPWFDAECRATRRECRRLERRYRRTGDAADRAAWTHAVRRKHVDFRSKKNIYWTERIEGEQHSPRKLWRSMDEILRRNRGGSQAPSVHTADSFLQAFDVKVQSVRSSTAGSSPADVKASAAAAFPVFRPCTVDEVRQIVMRSPTKSCNLDPIPTFMVKECIDALLPFLTAMCNASLMEGCLPLSQRHAVVTPLLKKPSLDPSDVKNYRPVSNLTFVSKIVEKLVAAQLVEYLESNNLMPRLQSAYRRHHSLNAVDNKQVTLLGLLDLSAAFDCVDHDILLQRLRMTFGIDGAALRWIESFLGDRTQRVSYGGQLSAAGRLSCGVPQGSVLGPLLFVLYTADLFDVIAQCGLTAHSYADDTQVYISAPAAEAASAVTRFATCVERIKAWMSSNRLKLNTDKTQVIWTGSRQQLAKVNITDLTLLSSTVAFSDSVNDLGVMVDGQLSMADHVAAISRSCFFQLRQLRVVRDSLSTTAAKTLVNAFVSSRLDYCNSLLAGITSGLLSRLQSVQNAAARLITRTRKFDHITPVLRDLHWLPIRRRIDFKVATIVYKCLHGYAPPYLADDCQLVSTLPGRRHLRSADTGTLYVPRTRTFTHGARAFAVTGPVTWNSLPEELRLLDSSLLDFRRKLKTYLFNL
jgi:Reverse transcriptase (RNA-dependent DNA polymerase)